MGMAGDYLRESEASADASTAEDPGKKQEDWYRNSNIEMESLRKLLEFPGLTRPDYRLCKQKP